MLRIIVAALLCGLVGFAQAPPATPIEQGVIRLHYVQKPIGYERYQVTRDGDGLLLSSDLDFTDRGGRSQLATTLKLKPDLTPTHFKAKGKSYRFATVDSEIEVHANEAIVRDDATTPAVNVKLPDAFFTVDGYAPFAAQMMLLRYWQRHGKPRTLTAVPGNPTNDLIIEY